MLTLQTSTAVENKTVIYGPGAMVLSASAGRDGLGALVWHPKYTLTTGTVSGLTIDHLHVDLWEVPRNAQNSLYMTSLPHNGDTLTVGDTVYTFRPAASGLVESHTIKIYDNVLSTTASIYKVINAVGTMGLDYGGSANAYARNNYPSNPLIFESLVSGISGQNVYMATSASGISIASRYFYNGTDITNNIVYSEDIAFPFKSTTTATSTNTLTGSLDGITYAGQAYFVNVSGLPVVASGTGNTLTFSVGPTTFTNHYSVGHLFEVSGLTALDLNAGKIDHDRSVSLSWTNMNSLSTATTLFMDYPFATGPQTQSSASVAAEKFGQVLDYYVFVCSGLAAPQCTWPRPTDANAVWYLAGTTRNNYATVHVPSSNFTGIWVGFTDIRDGVLYINAPFYRANSEIYLT